MIEVAYTLNDGKERIGTLVKNNAKTMLILPYRWIKCDAINVHKVKNNARIHRICIPAGEISVGTIDAWSVTYLGYPPSNRIATGKIDCSEVGPEYCRLINGK